MRKFHAIEPGAAYAVTLYAKDKRDARRELRIAIETKLQRWQSLEFAYAYSLGQTMAGRAWQEEVAKRAEFARESNTIKLDVLALLHDLEESE